MDNNLESLNKLKNNVDAMQFFTLFMNKEQKKQYTKIKTDLEHMLAQIELFDSIMPPRGWCFYDSFSITLMESVNQNYLEFGIDKAEEVLINYYKNDVKDSIKRVINGNHEFQIREKLLLNAFDDHFNGRYYASVPLFLIIIDGAVNDFTQSKGFFAEGTDVSAWDCVVGCSKGLTTIKSMYVKSRKKLNTSPIDIPYRNGILHGRDINYDNAEVSCKCVNLLYAVSDWVKMKRTEDDRKKKFEKECNSPPISESLKKIEENREIREEISSWEKREVIVGRDIPECGDLSDYSGFEYVQVIIEMLKYWKEKNYGNLSIKLKRIFRNINSKSRAGECKKLFSNKELLSYKIIEVEERAAALSRILVSVQFKKEDNIVYAVLEFGCVYESDGESIAVPWRKNGYWEIIPWKINELYN